MVGDWRHLHFTDAAKHARRAPAIQTNVAIVTLEMAPFETEMK